jgi:glycosyltransferase involved in cell wall biosynthesis
VQLVIGTAAGGGRRMRVALCHHFSLSYGGGGEQFLIELGSYLASIGHDVEIHALPIGRKRGEVKVPPEVLYCEKPMHRIRADVAYYVYAPLTRHLFRCSAPKVAGLHAAVVAEERASLIDSFRQGPLVFAAYLARQVVGHPDLRKFDAVHIVMRAHVVHPRVFLLPNWVDCSRQDASLRAKADRPSKFTVLYVGKPDYIKGFDLFVELSRLNDRDDIEFAATVPPGTVTATHGRVKCLDHVPHDAMWSLYARASAVVHPTRRETFGRVIIEALASGTPVITSPIPAHTGLGLPLEYASTISEMASKVRELHSLWKENYPSYLALGRRLADAASKYDAAALLPQYEAMLRAIADRRTSSRVTVRTDATPR